MLQNGARKLLRLTWGTTRSIGDCVTIRVLKSEGVNARTCSRRIFRKFDLAVMDVSFISATKVLPAIVPLMVDGGSIITLIKPQFEVGRGEVGGGGIVRDPAKRARVVQR